jgi:tRNA-splicing ligase RtcB
MMNDWTQRSNAVLRVRGLDKPQQCYRCLTEAFAADGSTIRVLHMLTPVGVAGVGANEFDPYED